MQANSIASRPIHPDTRIESTKAGPPPPTSGDIYEHPQLGPVKLTSRGPGASFWAVQATPTPANASYRYLVNPHKLRRRANP